MRWASLLFHSVRRSNGVIQPPGFNVPSHFGKYVNMRTWRDIIGLTSGAQVSASAVTRSRGLGLSARSIDH